MLIYVFYSLFGVAGVGRLAVSLLCCSGSNSLLSFFFKFCLGLILEWLLVQILVE